ncbi:MAG: ArsR/SmtB family transcription factor [Gemmatimonadales bacterium]
MVIDSPSRLDHVFHALADPVRREMVTLLTQGDKTAGELGAPFEISQPAASKHIRTLERAGLLSRSVEGRIHRLRLVSKPLREAETWISRHRQFWEGSLDSLGRALGEITRGGKA